MSGVSAAEMKRVKLMSGKKQQCHWAVGGEGSYFRTPWPTSRDRGKMKVANYMRQRISKRF